MVLEPVIVEAFAGLKRLITGATVSFDMMKLSQQSLDMAMATLFNGEKKMIQKF